MDAKASASNPWHPNIIVDIVKQIMSKKVFLKHEPKTKKMETIAIAKD